MTGRLATTGPCYRPKLSSIKYKKSRKGERLEGGVMSSPSTYIYPKSLTCCRTDEPSLVLVSLYPHPVSVHIEACSLVLKLLSSLFLGAELLYELLSL